MRLLFVCPGAGRSSPADVMRSLAVAAGAEWIEAADGDVAAPDFDGHDLVLAMDVAGLRALLRLAPDGDAAAKVHLLSEFDPASAAAGELDLPGASGPSASPGPVEAACGGLLGELRGR